MEILYNIYKRYFKKTSSQYDKWKKIVYPISNIFDKSFCINGKYLIYPEDRESINLNF